MAAPLGLDIFCRDTTDRELVANCLSSPGGDTTYLMWLLQAWGTAVSLAMLALVVAMAFGILMGILRTTPHKGLVLLGDACGPRLPQRAADRAAVHLVLRGAGAVSAAEGSCPASCWPSWGWGCSRRRASPNR